MQTTRPGVRLRPRLAVTVQRHCTDWLFGKRSCAELVVETDDHIALRRRYENEPQQVEPTLPLFVSPWLIAFSTMQHGMVAIHRWQVDGEQWRALRVRLRALRGVEQGSEREHRLF